MKKTIALTMGLAMTLMAGSALAADKLTLQLKWVTQGQFAGYYVAKDKGFYKDQQATGPVELWTFVANTGAQSFYRREGFAEMRRTDGDNEEHLPDILYRWQPEAGMHS